MRSDGELVLAAGFASECGPREDNQDFGGIYLGSPLERARHGSLAAVADGVSGGRGGRMAAELAVRALIEGFYSTPETRGAVQAIQEPLAAYNRWLFAQGQSEGMRGAATTCTAIALRGRRAHLAHVGDSRAWRFRDGRLTLLTSDHVRPEPDLSHVLIRALGIEHELRLDHRLIDLAEHDRLLLTTDGVHGVLAEKRIAAILAQSASAEAVAEELVAEAGRAGSTDNATALLVDIVRLPAPDHDGILSGLSALPTIEPPGVGRTVDGFRIDRVISEGRYATLLAATDSEDGARVALKFPRPAMLSERAIRLAFAREMLIAQRVDSPFVLAAHPVRPDRQTALYGVMPLLEGETLEDRLARDPMSMEKSLAIAIQATRGLAALHRLDVVHRDIKPENIMLLGDGGLKLIDLGVARLPRVGDFREDEIPGTPGYLAPEQFNGAPGDAKTDIFALGVVFYRLFAGTWPYGEQELFQRPRFAPARPPSHYRRDIPSWLDDAILTAINPDRTARFDDAVGLLRRLEGGGPIKSGPPRFVPLVERDPVRFWQLVSAALGAALVAALLLR